MAQPVSGDQWKSIASAGTTLVKNTNGVVRRVCFGGTYVGTVELHDASSTAGTTSTSQVISIGLPGAHYPESMELGIEFRKGIVYEATGTPVMTLVYD